jgi:hypothetical protein
VSSLGSPPPRGFDYRTTRDDSLRQADPAAQTLERDMRYSRGDVATRIAAVLLVLVIAGVVWVFVHGAQENMRRYPPMQMDNPGAVSGKR